MTNKTMTAAINEAIDQEMSRDDKVFVAGEDVRVGGPFGTEAGLHAKYGDKRILNTAISELALTGIGVGAASVGLPHYRNHDHGFCRGLYGSNR